MKDEEGDAIRKSKRRVCIVYKLVLLKWYGGVAHMRKREPIEIVIHGPDTEEVQRDLAKRAARVHAQAVESVVAKQRCSVREKIALLRAVANTLKPVREADEREL